MSKEINRLTHARFFQLCKLLESRKQEMTQEKPTMSRCAEMLSKEIGFTLTASQIGHACESTVINWKPQYCCGDKTTHAHRIQQLEKRVADLEEMVLKYCQEVEHLKAGKNGSSQPLRDSLRGGVNAGHQ